MRFLGVLISRYIYIYDMKRAIKKVVVVVVVVHPQGT
jgi:hypothetical protein